MDERIEHKIKRRKFLAWTSSIAGAAFLTVVFQSIYSGSLFRIKSAGKSAKKTNRRIRTKTAWNKEYLALNVKTNVIHFPSSKIFKYYNEILQEHSRKIGFDGWQGELILNRFNKGKSGIILEKLALRSLVSEINPTSLTSARDILSMAFQKVYVNENRFNWRIYDLLLTLIVLDESIGNKQSTFNAIISGVDLRSVRIPRKNIWLKSKSEFERKISYLIDNSQISSKKLSDRVKKFWSV